MKIFLITFHKTKAYGPVFQAYASWKTLEKLGHEFQFIDYVNETERAQFEGFSLSLVAVKYAIKRVIKNIFFKVDKNLGASFNEFLSTFPLTKPCSNLSDLNNLAADVFIVGSDQTWNAAICEGIDSAFYLNFGKAKKRISLASSMGGYRFNEKEKIQVKDYLARFSAISVREQFAKEQIQPLCNMPVEIICDPTFWLDAQYWRNMAQQPNGFKKNSYILYYALSNNQPQFSGEALAKAKESLNLPVVSLSSLPIKHPNIDQILTQITPEEFLWLVDNAAFVITSSFHGTAFSLNLNTPFWVLPPHQGSARIDELLRDCQLLDRKVTDSSSLPTVELSSFEYTNTKLESKRNHAIDWINKHLSF